MTIRKESEAYIVFTRATVAMGMSSKHNKLIVDGPLMETGSNIILSVSFLLSPAVRVANMRNIEQKMGNK